MSLLDTFRGNSPGRQIAFFAAAAIIVIAVLAAIYLLILRKPYEVLFTNLRTMDAATIIAELDRKKIPYRLRDEGTTILVPVDKVDATRLEVVSADLPLKGMVGFELFNKSDMGLTEFAQRINYQRALQGELARTIMTMGGIDTARVHLTIPEQSVFPGDRRAPKASVTVLPRAGANLTPATVGGIQRLVAASVADLEPGSVVILNAQGAIVSGDAQQSVATAGPQSKAIEQHFATRIRQSLTSLYEPQDINISVWADLDTRRAFSDPDQAGAPAWPDGPRDFRLRVAVSLAPQLAAQSTAQVRDLTAEAIGFDTTLGDIITVSPAVAPAPATAPALTPSPTPSAPQAMTRAPAEGVNWGFWIGIIVAILVVSFLALVAMARRPGPRSLTPQQRTEYAQRLSQLLDEGDAHAAPRS